MRNPGHPPDHSGPIDIRLRNGRVIRNTEARKWRWKSWDWGEDDWDVVDWQPSAKG